MHRLRWSAVLCVALVLAGCDGGGEPADDASAPPDAAEHLDAAAGDDAGMVDAGLADAALVDAAGDAATTACEAAGGSCDAVVPGACSGGIVGDARWYACGGGVGVLCCLPPTTPPACRFVGTRSEGWYRADGTRVCWASCDGAATPTCEAIGTRSEGWYTDPASAACTDPPVERLIEWTDCSP